MKLAINEPDKTRSTSLVISVVGLVDRFRLLSLYPRYLQSSGSTVTLWCECGTKQSENKRGFEEDGDSDSDIPASTSKQRKHSLSEEMNAHVQEVFEKLKAKHGDKYTGFQYRL